jgi:hypothetical protein
MGVFDQSIDRMRAPISLSPVRQSQPAADIDVAGFFTSQVFLRNTDYQPEGGCLRSNYEKTQNPHRLTIGRPPRNDWRVVQNDDLVRSHHVGGNADVALKLINGIPDNLRIDSLPGSVSLQ